MENYRNDYRFNRKGSQPDAEGFLTPHTIESGEKAGQVYYKGYLDLGGGKALRLMVFPIDAKRAEFAVKAYKKVYNANSKQSRKW
jgi:hypothetical protein